MNLKTFLAFLGVPNSRLNLQSPQDMLSGISDTKVLPLRTENSSPYEYASLWSFLFHIWYMLGWFINLHSITTENKR